MPGPYRLPQMGCRREGQGRAAALPFAVGGVDRERVVTQGPLEPFRPCRLGQPFGPGPLCRSATSPRAAGSHP